MSKSSFIDEKLWPYEFWVIDTEAGDGVAPTIAIIASCSLELAREVSDFAKKRAKELGIKGPKKSL